MRTQIIRLTSQQYDLLAYEEKIGGARGGVGSGKTVTLCLWLWRRTEEYPEAAHYVIGADYEQLRRGFFQSMIGILTTQGLEQGRDFTYRESPSPMLTFTHNGAEIKALSAELKDRIRSVEFQSLVLEEPQTWQDGAAVFEVAVARLRHRPDTEALYGANLKPQMRLSFNPTRDAAVGSWLHSLIEKRWPREGYKCWRFSVRDNVLMPGRDEYVHLLESNLPEDRWASEIDGHWCTSGGAVYRTFDRLLNCRSHPELPPFAIDAGAPLLWALDFNVGWMSSVVAQQHAQRMHQIGMSPTDIRTGISRPVYGPTVPGWQDRVLYVLDELFLQDAGSPDVVAEFLRRYGATALAQGVVLYGDTSGGARSQTASSASAARSNWAIIVQGLVAAGIRVQMRVPMSNPSVGDRINAVNAQFRTGSGIGMVVDENRCPELLADFAEVRYVVGKNDIDKADKSENGLKRTHCFPAGTMVSTEDGRVAIEDVRPGVRVWTRSGLRSVLACGLTGIDRDTLCATMDNGARLTATPEHPVFSPGRGGFVPFDSLRPGDSVLLETLCNQPASTTGEHTVCFPVPGITDIPKPSLDPCDTFIATYGRMSEDRFLRGITSTTSTATRSIMPSRTSNASQAKNTTRNIATGAPHGGGDVRKAAIWPVSKKRQKPGTLLPKASHGILKTGESPTPSVNFALTRACNARRFTKPRTLARTSFALRPAKHAIALYPESTTRTEPVRLVGRRFQLTGTSQHKTAVGHVLHVHAGERQNVYDLTVEDQPEFFANGVLVHNCSDALGYLIHVERSIADNSLNMKNLRSLSDYMAR